jgi:hypothetical protein
VGGGKQSLSLFIITGRGKPLKSQVVCAIPRERFGPGFFECKAELPIAMMGLSV